MLASSVANRTGRSWMVALAAHEEESNSNPCSAGSSGPHIRRHKEGKWPLASWCLHKSILSTLHSSRLIPAMCLLESSKGFLTRLLTERSAWLGAHTCRRLGPAGRHRWAPTSEGPLHAESLPGAIPSGINADHAPASIACATGTSCSWMAVSTQ